MIQNLEKKGVNIPGGFAITATAYRHLLKEAGIEDDIKDVLKDLNTHDMENLQTRGQKVREIIRNAEFTDELKTAILDAYHEMINRYDADLTVAVRSSATAEDLPDASFAGQQETYLNIKGDDELIDACRRCFASLFTNRAISYRQDKGFGHFDVYLSIAVQKMIRSDFASSGVLFTIDTESGFKDAVFITGSYGLGENVVQGAVNPDEFYVFKPTLKDKKRPIVGKKLGTKAIKMIYADGGDEPVKNIDTPQEDRDKFSITDDEVLKLAEWACIIEEHYSEEAGYFKPMDIEWAKDGDGKNVGTGNLFIVQARPETVHSQKDKNIYETYVLKEKSKALTSGKAVGSKISTGKVHVIESAENIGEFKKGEILVTDMTDPDWEPIMKIAGAIVTNRGGRTCHAAIISRELGITCVVGTDNATDSVSQDQDVTVCCAEGDEGIVYDGTLKFDVEVTHLDRIPKTKTMIMMNVGTPEQAFNHGQLPNDGVGLAREEFITNSHIGIHPNAILDYEKLKEKAKSDDKVAKAIKKIDARSVAYADKVEFYVNTLAMGIGRIAAAFYPKDVIVRLADFKSNEYANLIGGYLYEPEESNPMIGWRGASRYYDPKYKAAFEMECKALIKVREDMGLNNVKVMVPFCRTVAEGKKVIAT